jgi:TonB family protein
MTTRTIEWAPPQRRSTAFLAIVALHALVIYGFLSVFVPPKAHSPPPDLNWTVIDQVPRTEPDPIPGPLPFRPTAGQPVPIPPLPLPPLGSTMSEEIPASPGTEVGSSGGLSGAGAAVALSYVVTRQINEYYPSQAIRLNQEGASTLQVCVAANGLLAGAPTLEASSGYRLLDTAALKWAREALRFTPAQRGGKAVPGCKGFRVTFKLNL